MRFAKTHNTAWTRIDFSWTIIFNPRSSLHQRSLCYIYHDRERNEPRSFLTNVSPRPSTSWRSQPPTRTSLPPGFLQGVRPQTRRGEAPYYLLSHCELVVPRLLVWVDTNRRRREASNGTPRVVASARQFV